MLLAALQILTQMNFKNMMPSGRSQLQKSMLWLHSHTRSRLGKSMGPENRPSAARSWGQELRTDQGFCSFICNVSFLGTCHSFSQRSFRFHNVAFPTCPTLSENSKWAWKSFSFALHFLLTWKENELNMFFFTLFFIGIAESSHRDNFLGWQLLYIRTSSKST